MKTRLGSLILPVLTLSVLILLAFSLSLPAAAQSSAGFQLSSSTFQNNTTLPISMINNNIVNNLNTCSLDGSAGGNQSPELTWSNAPKLTVSFVVTIYDTTAAFTHWGMFNISSAATGLPENAGVAGSTYGKQIVNDFFEGAEYDGPCPPAGYRPYAHQYVVTVYALDTTLDLPTSVNFPANAETLYQALIKAGKKGHVLASSSIVGLYSTTPSTN
jgi:Raf kinase inhibitor-like YbhB/YbcL family protein